MSYDYTRLGHDRRTHREYSVVIYLPERLERYVVPLRERFDPNYELVAAHITLVFPWETEVPLANLSSLLTEAVNQFSPFTVRLESVGDFYPESPILYWCVAPNESLSRLYGELYARLDLPLPFKELVPHVTVGKEISAHRVVLVKDQIASYLPSESFEVNALDLVSPVTDQHWVSTRTFRLAKD